MKPHLMLAAMAASAALLTPTVAEAHSAEAEPVATETVFYGDLNLSTEAGRARLDRRIHAALQRVCGNPGDPMLRAAAHARGCIAEGKAKASADVQLAARAGTGTQVVVAAR